MYDNLKIGDLITESWLDKNAIESEAIGRAYDLKLRSDLTAESPNVRNTGELDISNVYEVVKPYNQTSSETLTSIETLLENHICTDNTSTTPLGANATFTGAWQDCLEFAEVNISIDTDQNSATNGLSIQWSANGTTLADSDVFTVYANSGTNYTPNPAFRYVRVIYTNGATPQTRFNLMTILRRRSTGGSFHRITDTLKDDSDGRLGLSVLKLRTAANTYVSGSATTSGNFKMSLEELESGISTNSNSQLKTTIYDELGEPAEVDNATHTLQTIDYAHHEVHSGSSFYYHDVIALGNGAIQNYLITTPNTTSWGHFGLEIDYNDAAGITELYETTDKVGTTLQTTFNRNRNSATTATITIHKAISGGTTDGTRILWKRNGVGRTSGGVSGTAEERILKQNTKYILRLTNTSTSTNNVSVVLRWYEHTNK